MILYSDHKLTVLVVNILLHIYAVHAWPESTDGDDSPEGRGKYINANSNQVNGHTRSPSEAQRARDAEEFELQGLISDDEEGGSSMGPKRHADEEMGTKEVSHS